MTQTRQCVLLVAFATFMRASTVIVLFFSNFEHSADSRECPVLMYATLSEQWFVKVKVAFQTSARTLAYLSVLWLSRPSMELHSQTTKTGQLLQCMRVVVA